MPEARLFPLDGAQRLDPAVEAWFSAPSSTKRDLARVWFDEWQACGTDVKALLHDGHPTVCLQGIALGYVNAFKAHVNVGFFLGSTLQDPIGLLQGGGKFMRHAKVYPNSHDNVELRVLLRAAYEDLKGRLAEAATSQDK